MFRRTDAEEQDDGLNIYSDDGDEQEFTELFVAGQPCDVCGAEGRIGVDPTVRGTYEGSPVLGCLEHAPDLIRRAFDDVQGISVIVEPFGDYDAVWYYRLDELPSYQFVREDVEGVSWLLLAIGGPCSRCSEQSRHAWIPSDHVDPKLPEGRPVFRGIDGDFDMLCNRCASSALATACAELSLPLLSLEVPRGAMGLLIPTGD